MHDLGRRRGQYMSQVWRPHVYMASARDWGKDLERMCHISQALRPHM